MPYTSTNDWATVVETTPLGTESPNVIDDSIRETRKVAKATVTKCHTSIGLHRVASWKHNVTANTSGGAANTWVRRPMTTIVDATSLLAAGTYANSIKPIAGVYAIRFYGFGFDCDQLIARIAQATGNTTSPSASTEIADLLGCIAFADSAQQVAGVSHGMGILTADGIKSYCFDQMNGAASAVAGWGLVPFGGVNAPSYNTAAAVEFLLIG